MFSSSEFTVQIAPLNAFENDNDTWASVFPDGWGTEIEEVRLQTAVSRKDEATFKTWSRGQPLQPAPYPKNDDGEKLCHGSVLLFEERPVHLHSTIALQRWLIARNIAVPGTHRETYLGGSLIHGRHPCRTQP